MIRSAMIVLLVSASLGALAFIGFVLLRESGELGAPTKPKRGSVRVSNLIVITEELFTGIRTVRANVPLQELDQHSRRIVLDFDQKWQDLPVPDWGTQTNLREFYAQLRTCSDVCRPLNDAAAHITDEKDPLYRAATLYACFDIFESRFGKLLYPDDPMADTFGAWPYENKASQ